MSTLAIPAKTEVIVQIAFRIQGDKFALESPFMGRYQTRTPEELDAVVEAFRDLLWLGTLRTLRHIASSPTPASRSAQE